MIRTEDYIRNGKQLHIIKEIKPKDGKLQEIHQCLLGHICYLNGLKNIVGDRPVILSETNYDPGCMHHVQLSPLESVKHEDGLIIATTLNTVYVFEPFNGGGTA